jgi:hypothetical protein
VDVAGVDATPVFELLEESWRRKAPRRLVAARDQRLRTPNEYSIAPTEG